MSAKDREMGVSGASRSLSTLYVVAPIAFRKTGTCLLSGILFATKKMCTHSRYADNELSSGLNSSSFPSAVVKDTSGDVAGASPDGVAIVRVLVSILVASCYVSTTAARYHREQWS